MDSFSIGLNHSQLLEAFPFHFVFDTSLKIQQAGKTLTRICGEDISGTRVNDIFRFKYPQLSISFESIKNNLNLLYIAEHLRNGMLMRGQMLYNENPEYIIFLCSLWVTEIELMRRLNLSLDDFALHDPINELMQLLEMQRVSIEDAKKAKERLSAERKRLRAMFDTVVDSIIIIDQRGVIEAFNPSAEKIFGYEAREVIGQNVTILMPEPHRSNHPICLEHNLDSTVPHIIGFGEETEGLKKDGTAFPIELTVGEMVIGGAHFFTCVIRDISDRREREKRYRHLLESASDIIYETDASGRFKFFNPAALKITGYSEEELLRLDFQTLICPKFREEVKRFYAEQFANRTPSSYLEFQIITKAEQEVWLGQSVQLIAEGSRVAGFHVVARDITARKRAEEALQKSEARLQAILDTAADSIITINEKGIIQTFNRAAEKTFGYESGDVVGSNVKILMPAPYREKHDAFIANYLRTGESRVIGTGREVPALRKDGSIFSADLSLSDVRTTAGRLFTGILRDISERKEAEAILREAKEAAEAASRTKSEFLANISHEIRTPMNAIIGMAELLGETQLSADQGRFVGVLKNAGENLLSLIDDILDLSKIEAGRLVIQSVDFDLEDIIVQTCGMLALRANEKGLEFLYRILPEVPLKVIGDPVRLRQVLVNLVGNAIKFTDKGEVVVEVGKDIDALQPDQVRLLFSVQDSGIGIPKDKIDMVFQRFIQADSSTTRPYGGSGLGLTITKHLVERMGGDLRVESAPGEGSRFYFGLPFVLPKTAEEPIRETYGIAMRGLRVLVIDDNALSRGVLREMLSGWGCIVEEADNGVSGIQKLRTCQETGGSFGLVLLDNRMPVMDGAAVAEQMMNDASLKKIPVVMLTSILSHNLRQSPELRLAGCLAKPVRRSELKAVVLSALSGIHAAAKELLLPTKTLAAQPLPLHLLLVDDSEDNRLLIESFLKKYPFTIDSARDGQAALEQFKREKYDLVLMDMQMPIMDGYTATREIRNWEQQNGLEPTPIVALTAYALEKERLKSLEAGCDAHITKPIKKAMLLEMVQRLARKTR